jgi:hypothetical protein
MMFFPSLDCGCFFFGNFLQAPRCPGPVRGTRTETGLRVDRRVALDPVEQVEVAHLVVVGRADGNCVVKVVHLDGVETNKNCLRNAREFNSQTNAHKITLSFFRFI